MWIRINRYKTTDKMKGKKSLTNNKKKNSQEIIFLKSEP